MKWARWAAFTAIVFVTGGLALAGQSMTGIAYWIVIAGVAVIAYTFGWQDGAREPRDTP